MCRLGSVSSCPTSRVWASLSVSQLLRGEFGEGTGRAAGAAGSTGTCGPAETRVKFRIWGTGFSWVWRGVPGALTVAMEPPAASPSAGMCMSFCSSAANRSSTPASATRRSSVSKRSCKRSASALPWLSCVRADWKSRFWASCSFRSFAGSFSMRFVSSPCSPRRLSTCFFSSLCSSRKRANAASMLLAGCWFSMCFFISF
mmetsp:Transcript_30138/g.70123  ORF Transcript_30138/g.70123 Transcript_30138/m.70123 type:complete len:201 (+) Transcript_30138:1179-1781(+)